MRIRSWFTLSVLGLAALAIALGGPLPHPPTTHAQSVITAEALPRDAADPESIKIHGKPAPQPGGIAELRAAIAEAAAGPDGAAPLDVRPLFGAAWQGEAGSSAPAVAAASVRDAAGAPGAIHGPSALACTVGSLAAGAAADGRLDDGDCRLPQVIGGNNPSYADQYRVELAERGRLTVNVGRGDFDPYVAILDDQYYIISESTSAGAAAETGLALPAGTFIVVVGAAGATANTQGAYRVTTTFQPEATPQNCEAAEPLAPGGSASGALAVGDCRLFDVLSGVFSDPYAQLYAITVPQAGELSLEMGSSALRSLLILATTDFEPINAGRAGDANPNTLTLTSYVRAGTYVAIASSASAATGGFTLGATFTPNTTDCTPAITDADDSVTGQLAPDGCHLAYLPTGAYDQSPAALYEIALPQDGEYRIRVNAQGFTPALRAYNIHYDALLNRPLTLPPGTTGTLIWPYARTLILAIGAAEGGPASGSFTAELDFEPGGTACSVAEIDPTAAVDGQLGISDCQLADVNPGELPFNSRADQYRVTIAERGSLSVAMTSTAYETHLMSFDENFILLGADAAEADRNTRLDFEVYPGTYVILATSNTASAGAYRLATTFQPLPKPADCPIPSIQPNADIAGALATTDCRATDVMPGVPTQEYVDRYRLTLPARGRLVLEQKSGTGASALGDSLIEIYDAATYTRLARNDDASGNTYDSKLDLMLPAGAYILHATTPKLYGGVTTGGYALTTRFTAQPAPASCPIGDLGLDAREQGSLDAATDCLLFDTPLGGYLGVPVRLYGLHLPQAGVLTVDLQALGFNALLAIYDPRWNLLRANDDVLPGISEDSQIVWTAPPGFYIVAAISGDGATGDYLLDTQFEPEEYVPPAVPTPTRTVPVTPTRSTPTPTREPTPTRTHEDGGKIYLPYGAKEVGRL